MNKKSRTRLKFALFVIFVALVITVLLILENYRNHPDYAPMFSGIVALPALYFIKQWQRDTAAMLRAHSPHHLAINQDQ